MRPITSNLWNLQRVLHTLAATQEVPRHIHLHSGGITRVPPTCRGDPFPPPSSRGGILSLRVGERISRVPVASQVEALSTGKSRGITGSPRCLSPFQGNLFSLHCLDFQAEDRLAPRWHLGQPCGKASWESLMGKPRGKATDPLILAKGSLTPLLHLGRKAHVHAPTRDED